MTRVAVIGAGEQIRGFVLAGVHVAAADDADAARAAWRDLPADVGLVILTAAARGALGADALVRRDSRLWVVMPG
jgi:vacuolar-type H+-ATPase subunit F/Vma7